MSGPSTSTETVSGGMEAPVAVGATCPHCGSGPQTTYHLFDCQANPISCKVIDLWCNPTHVAHSLSCLPSISYLHLSTPYCPSLKAPLPPPPPPASPRTPPEPPLSLTYLFLPLPPLLPPPTTPSIFDSPSSHLIPSYSLSDEASD